jgi:LPXTG-motif cell wall-anchored protein
MAITKEMGSAQGSKLTADEFGRFYTGYLSSGTYYIVEKTAPEGYKLLDHPVKIVVSENGVEYDLSGGDSLTSKASDKHGYYNIYLDNEKQIEVTKVWKNSVGENVEWVQDITIQLHKNPSSGTGTVYQYVVSKTDDGYSAASTDPDAPAAVVEVVEEYGYVIRFKAVDPGYSYYVTETQIDGYKEPEYGIRTNHTGNWNFTTTDSNEVPLAYAADGQYIINRPNDSYALPSTGGIGTGIYTAIGMLLIGFAGVLLLRRKRNEVRNL